MNTKRYINLVNAIKGKDSTLHWRLKEKVAEIYLLCSNLETVSFEHVSKTHIKAAHYLATWANSGTFDGDLKVVMGTTDHPFCTSEHDSFFLHETGDINWCMELGSSR